MISRASATRFELFLDLLILSFLVLAANFSLAAQTQGPRPGRPLPEPVNPKLPSLFLIGDSTVRNGDGNGSNGQWGWGDHIADYFNPKKINVVNRALGGLSSRTYLTFDYWDRLMVLLKPGDFVINPAARCTRSNSWRLTAQFFQCSYTRRFCQQERKLL